MIAITVGNMSQTPEKEDPVLSARFSPGSSSSFDKMVHDATKSVLSEGAGNGNITALSVATGQMAMSPTTPTLNERSHNDAYISPVETLTFSPSNENNIGMSTNPDQVIITEKNSGVNVTSPVVANSFDFMSTSLVTDKSGDVEATVTTEERAAEAYTTDDIAIGKSSSTTLTPTATDTDTENAEKIGITKSLSTCPTGLGSENDDPANESGINMLRRVNRLCRPAWLWVFVVSVLAFAIAIVAIVGANMMKEKDSNADSINGIGLGNTLGPTLSPTTAFPSESPSESPSFGPTLTVGPSDRPSISPTSFPTTAPSFAPTNFPTVSAIPSDAPSEIPTQFPSASPSSAPTDLPSTTPSDIPSTVPSKAPTIAPTGNPTISSAPTVETHVLLMELLNNITDTPLQVLDDPSTPQGRALLWMATEDKVVMDLVHTAVVGEEAAMVVPMTDTDNATNALTPPAPVSAPGGLSPEVLFHLPQRYAVVTLDLSLHANSDILWSFPNLHECEWPGVICDRSEEIIAIDWARQNLTGYVAPEVSLLTELERLDLAQNQLTGFVDVFWNLPQLKTLYLHENQFMGPIGTEIGNLYNLEELYLGNNQLTGRIPEEVFELDDLRK